MQIQWAAKEDRKFLYPKSEFVGFILTAHPLVVFLGLAVIISTLLFVPAWLLKIHSIPIDFHKIPGLPCSKPNDGPLPSGYTNVGIFYKLNWSLAYSFFIPAIFGLAAAASRSIRNSLIGLVQDGTVQPDLPQPQPDESLFLNEVLGKINKWDRLVSYTSLTVAILASLIAANVFSKKGNLYVYGQVFKSHNLESWYDPCLWDDLDWMHAWTIPGHQGHWPHMIGNFLFYLLAETIQGFVIFLACSFVLKFLLLTQSFTAVIIEEKSGFHFEPFISDPDKCLGLRPMGRIFSLFLLLSILFQVYAFGCRLQLILTDNRYSLFGYIADVSARFKALGQAKDYTSAQPDVLHLILLSGFRDLNHGMVAMLVLMVIPVLVIAWMPVIQLRNYVACIRKEKIKQLRQFELDARQTQRYDQAKHLADDMDKLSKASIWPNGFKIGWGSFFFLFALLVSTFVPPLIVPLVSGGVGLKLFNKLTES